MASLDTVWLTHNRIQLALHQLQGGPGVALLLLHALGEHTPSDIPAELRSWPGPVWGLDFTGHGGSTVPVGGGYTCELLMGDADLALGHLGEAAIHGRGLGGYVAVLLAGARPAAVRGVIVDDGRGLAGGGPRPETTVIVAVDPSVEAAGPPDPYAVQELARDARPVDYVTAFAHAAVDGSGLATMFYVSASDRPPWLEALVEEPGARVLPLARALDALAAAPSNPISSGG